MSKNQVTQPVPTPAPSNGVVNDPFRGGMTFNFEQLNIISQFQKLWTQLAVFMRASINSNILNASSAPHNAARLLTMTRDFRNVMMLFYGPELADQFNQIFTSFLAKPINIVQGLMTNNQELVNQSVQNWYGDANELANFLASINLNWYESQWRNLLYQYIQLKLQMITSLMSGDYEREIQIYDRVFDLTTMIGAYMARGLIAQQYQDFQRR